MSHGNSYHLMKPSQLKDILSEELDLGIIEIRTLEGKMADDSIDFYQKMPLGYRGYLETDEGVRMIWDITTKDKKDWDVATTVIKK